MEKDDIFMAMIEEELNQYNHFFLYNEKNWIKNKNYRELARSSLKKTWYLAVSAIAFIICFSIFSVYHFVQFGTHGEWTPLILGLISWGFIIFATFIFSRDILQRRKTMERVLKLLNAREEFYQTDNE